jgi:hypothetical protein
MIGDDRFDARLADWFQGGPFTAPGRGVDAAIAHAWAHPRGRLRWALPWLRPRRTRPSESVLPAPVVRVGPTFRLAWAIAAITLLLLALFGSALVASRWLAVAPLPGNGLLAFSYEDDVWTVSPDGSATRNITASADEIETAPTWSPDGRWLAVRVQGAQVSLFRIDVMRPDGTGRRAISGVTSATQGPLAWSPDSRLVAVAIGETLTARVTLLDVDGREQPRVVGAIPGSWPAFSPDGDRLAFVGLPDGEGRRDLYVADVASGSTVRLTGPWNTQAGLISHPSWAGGGRSIVFDAGIAEGGTLAHYVYAIDADGSHLRSVSTASGWRSEHEFGTAPVVGPDGRNVAFSGQGSVWTVGLDADGAAVTLGRQSGPDGIEWSPDGTSVAYLDWASCETKPGEASSTGACLQAIRVAGPDRYGTYATWTAPAASPADAGAPPDFTWDLSWQPMPLER